MMKGKQGAGGQPTPARMTGALERPRERLRILVVDDDRAILKAFAHALSAIDVDLVAVRRGEEAMAAVKAAPLFLAFVDIVLPGIDGLETLRALRAKQPQLPVIMMTTSHAKEDVAVLADYLGAAGCLSKPFRDGSEILKMIQRVRNRQQPFEKNDPPSTRP